MHVILSLSTLSPSADCNISHIAAGLSNYLILIHQEGWQQRLLQRYGSELLFKDATYKTTKYDHPLFFVCVRTNVVYKVVAEFMTQNEGQQSISEALSILKSWNPLWQPKYFMADFSTVKIGAMEEQFPKATTYIRDF